MKQRSLARWKKTIVIVLVVVLLQMVLVGLVGYAAPPRVRWHRVQWGQNLTHIARWYGTTVWAIVQENGLSNPNWIYAGQWLRIPASGGWRPTPKPTWYRVQPGDTLTGIAWRYGTTIWAIANLNGIPNVNRIYAGRWLRIP